MSARGIGAFVRAGTCTRTCAGTGSCAEARDDGTGASSTPACTAAAASAEHEGSTAAAAAPSSAAASAALMNERARP